MIDQIVGDLRATIVRGVVRAVNDGGALQTVDVETADGFIRAGVEVMQVFGHAGMPPAEGIGCILLAVGGDPGNYVALPLASPARRFGNQPAGDSTLRARLGRSSGRRHVACHRRQGNALRCRRGSGGHGRCGGRHRGLDGLADFGGGLGRARLRLGNLCLGLLHAGHVQLELAVAVIAGGGRAVRDRDVDQRCVRCSTRRRRCG